MQVSVETTSGIGRRMTIEVPATQVEQEVAKRLDRTARSARINGFRPGKAPMTVIRKRFGEGVRQEVVGELMRDSYIKALQEKALQPAGYPRFEPKNMTDGQDLSFVAVFEVYPEVAVGDLAALVITKAESQIGDADVEKMVDVLRRQGAKLEEVARPAQDKDVVTIDFDGFIDGVAFEGGAAKGYRLNLGGGQMIPGFEAGIVGMKADETRDVTATFPADYQKPELAGKVAVFKVVVRKIEEPALPALDTAFFERFGLENADEAAFLTEVRGNMGRELRQALSAQTKASAIDALLAANTLEIPQSLVAQEVDVLRQDAVRQFGGGGQFKPEDLPAELFKDQAVRRVSTGLIFAELIRANDIKVDGEKVDERIKELASTYQQPEQVIEWYSKNKEQRAQIENAVLEDQVVDLILSKAKVETTSLAYEDAVKQARQGR